LPICIDASVVVRLVTGAAAEITESELWREWLDGGSDLIGPTLLFFEVTNALHRYAVHGELLAEEVEEALEAALALEIRLHGGPDIHRRALRLARQLNLPATYDAHYLAVAERSQATFWTADARLVRAVRPSLPWVRLLGSKA